MLVIQEDETGRLWWAPHLEIPEAAATAEYWRRLGIACEVTIVPDEWYDREVVDDADLLGDYNTHNGL